MLLTAFLSGKTSWSHSLGVACQESGRSSFTVCPEPGLENAFGILSSQWRMYRCATEVHPEVAEKCVKATCVLHNFSMEDKPDNCSEGEHPSWWGGATARSGETCCQQLSKRGHQVREVFTTYFSAQGSVPWRATVWSTGTPKMSLLSTTHTLQFSKYSAVLCQHQASYSCVWSC